MSTRQILNSLAGAACTALVACGGGGGGDPTPAASTNGEPLVITGANYVVVAQESLSSSAAIGDTSALATGAQTARPQPLFDFARSQSTRLGASLHQPLAMGVSASFSEPCPEGGTLILSFNDANGNGLLDTGDSFAFTYSGCGLDGLVYDGSLSFTVDSLSGSLDSYPHAASLTVGFQDLRASSALLTSTANGTVAMRIIAAADNDFSVSVSTAPSFSESTSSAGSSYSRTLNGYTVAETRTPSGTGYLSSVSVNGQLVSSAFDGRSVAIATPQSWLRNDSAPYPASGQAMATGARGSRVLVTAIDGSTVRIELDADGDGSYETATTRAWSELI